MQTKTTTTSPIRILVIIPDAFKKSDKEPVVLPLYRELEKDNTNITVSYLLKSPPQEDLPNSKQIANMNELIKAYIDIFSKRFEYIHVHGRSWILPLVSWIIGRSIGAKSIFSEEEGPITRKDTNIFLKMHAFLRNSIAHIFLSKFDIVLAFNESAKTYLTTVLQLPNVHELMIKKDQSVDWHILGEQFFFLIKRHSVFGGTFEQFVEEKKDTL